MKRILATSLLAIVLASCETGDNSSADDLKTPVLDVGTGRSAEIGELLMPLPETTTAITAADLSVRIAALADDVFEGRGPGSEKGEKSADWVAAELQRVGVKPGNKGSWFQTVEMVNQSVDEGLSALKVSSSADAEPMKLGDETVIWSKRQNALDMSFSDSEVVFVGYGAVAPEYGWNDYEGLDVKGKTVIILVNDPGFSTQNPDLFNGNAMTYYGRWTYKFEEAARQGATAAIIVHETEPASYGWDVVRNSWSGAQSDLVRNNGGEDRAVLEGWITHEVAERLFAEGGHDYAALKVTASKPDFKPVSLGGLKASGRIVQTIEKATSRNVIGMIEGTETPDEYVLYTAHWDHLGKANTPEDTKTYTFQADKIYNGAVDNATGTAALIEIAEAFANAPPKRSVLFAAVTLEESGLLGSAYMAENPIIPSHQIVAGVNMDGMMPTGRSKNMIVVGYGASELEDILAEILKEQDRVVTPDPLPQNGYFYRSDHISYAKKGIPMLYADGGEDLVQGGKEAGQLLATEYTRLRYHKPQDEFSENWNLSGMEEDIIALFEVGNTVANSSDWPTWYPGNEFEAIRKADLEANVQ